MSEKPSQLLSKARDLIASQNLKDALIIVEKVINSEPNNINGLLLATKCWIDLDIERDRIKSSLEKILLLKPDNQTAKQGLRRFYDKYWDSFEESAKIFYRQLFISDKMIDKDWEIITERIARSIDSIDTENFVWECLLQRINKEKHLDSLKTVFRISVECLIVRHSIDRFKEFTALLVTFNQSSETDDIELLRNMVTLVNAFLEQVEPEKFYALLNDNNSNAYSYSLFAELLCDHYLFSNCQDVLQMAMDKLNQEEVLQPELLKQALKLIEIKNGIRWERPDVVERSWCVPKCDGYLWCQACVMGDWDPFQAAGLSWSDVEVDWCASMAPEHVIISRALMAGSVPLHLDMVERDHRALSLEHRPSLTSWDWYLWAVAMKQNKFVELYKEALEAAIACQPVFYRALVDKAALATEKPNAVALLWQALDKHLCSTVLEMLVDLHMTHEEFTEPIDILENIEIEICSESLITKFTLCLNNLERITDAISIAQRLVKLYPSNGENWRLLGDLYLRRGNIKSAFTTYSRALEIMGRLSGMLTRIGNVFSMKYQQSFDESDYKESIKYFQESIEIEPSMEAIEGESSVRYLHAETLLKQLMLHPASVDIQRIIDLFIDQYHLVKDSLMNLLGKAIFLSIMGSIDNLICLERFKTIIPQQSSSVNDIYGLASRCFKLSIQRFPHLSESYLHLGILILHKINSKCCESERGSVVYPSLYEESEKHFKEALHLNPNLCEAWKYLGYLYFRHGASNLVFEIQHCLSKAVNITGTEDKMKDFESAYLLGILYIREDWCDLAKEIFFKIQMDYPVNPIGYIGMYLLASKDHTIHEQSNIAKALLCYNYRDEESNFDDSCYNINDSILGLFCDNLGFLVNSNCDRESFGSSESICELIFALKDALCKSWMKYMAYKSIGSHMTGEITKQFQEYGCFLGILDILTGNQKWGKLLIQKFNDENDKDSFSMKLSYWLKLDNSWINRNYSECLENMKCLITSVNLSLDQDISNKLCPTTDHLKSVRMIDECLLSLINHYMVPSQNKLIENLEILITKLPSLCDQTVLPLDFQSSIFLTLGVLISTTKSASLALSFVETVEKYFPFLDADIECFARVLSRVKTICDNSEVGFRYLYNHCLKQPNDMNRWLDLLEFRLEYSEDLKELIDLSKIFFITSRPWSFAPFYVERYANLLFRYSEIVTSSCLSHHKHMIMRSARLFPSLCTDIIKKMPVS